MLIVNIVLFLLALTVVEFYKDTYTGLLNREAYEQYTKRDIYERSNKAVYLIKLKNYTYLKENCHEVIEDMRSLADEIVTKLILPYEDRIKFDLVDEE